MVQLSCEALTLHLEPPYIYHLLLHFSIGILILKRAKAIEAGKKSEVIEAPYVLET